MHIYDVLKRPVDTEKTRFQGELYEPQYSFEIDRRANKQQVKQAVEEIFDVDVIKVRIMNVKPKRGRYGRRIVVRKSGWKKAVVTVYPGQVIEGFSSVAWSISTTSPISMSAWKIPPRVSSLKGKRITSAGMICPHRSLRMWAVKSCS